MLESPCLVCGEVCLHTDDDEQPLCDSCAEAVVWKRLVVDIALERIEVPEGFSPEEFVAGIKQNG